VCSGAIYDKGAFNMTNISTAKFEDMILKAKEMADVYTMREENNADPMQYSYRLQKGEQHLFFVGATHSFDPEHPFFDGLEQWANDFIKVTDSRRMVFVEGGLATYLPDRTDTIKQYGENGYTQKLFSRVEHLLESPEPNRPEEMRLMLEKFTLQQVMAYYILRQHLQWRRGDNLKSPDYKAYILHHAERYRPLLEKGVHDDPFTYEEIIKICEQETGVAFDQEARQPSYLVSDPSSNPVSEYSSSIRDRYILQRIAYALSLGLSVFVVYGSGHAIKLEKALRSLMAG
jgi:hypothetical protein